MTSSEIIAIATRCHDQIKSIARERGQDVDNSPMLIEPNGLVKHMDITDLNGKPVSELEKLKVIIAILQISYTELKQHYINISN